MSRVVPLLVLLPVLAGCAGSYGCQGLPDDPVCLSAVEAYRATERTPPARAGTAPTTAAANPASVAHPASPAPHPRIDDPTPIRTPSEVMRIWIAPWEDDEGDLQVSGYVFTELEPRRWLIGQPAGRRAPSLTPLQVLHRPPERAAPRPLNKNPVPSLRPSAPGGEADDDEDD